MNKIWNKIKTWYNGFNDWVASWAPGFKTLIIAALGAVGSFAGVIQEYISGLPLDQFISGTKLAMLTGLLFTLAFWFKMISNRA